jgi:Flp pilus assembly protein TadB
MKDFEALKNIWHNQVSLPKVSDEDVLKKVRKTKTGFANKLLIELIGMLLAIAMLIYVWIDSPFKMWTTHLAMIILIACCLYYLYVQLRDYNRIKDDSLLLSKPEEYIDYLKRYKHDRYILNTRKYTVYTWILGFGFLFYFIEIAFLASIWVTVMGVFFTAAWILFCYFVLMRRYVRKEEFKLGEMIDNLERLQKQFSAKEPDLGDI